jgi:hypothetical protein
VSSVEFAEKCDQRIGPAVRRAKRFKRVFQPLDKPFIGLFPNLRLSCLSHFADKCENTIMPARNKGAALAEFDIWKTAEQKPLQAITPIRRFGFPFQARLLQP